MSAASSVKEDIKLIKEVGDEIDIVMSYVMRAIIQPIKDTSNTISLDSKMLENPYFFRALCVLTRAASLEYMDSKKLPYSVDSEYFYLKQFIDLQPSFLSDQRLRENIKLVYEHSYPDYLSIKRKSSARVAVPKELPVVTKTAMFKVSRPIPRNNILPTAAAAAAAGGSSV